MMDKNIEFKQVVLVTDGESNVGCDPITVAKEAFETGIIISTIGIVDNKIKERPMIEIEKIADAGGGLWELTDIDNFTRTMEMVTQKSIYMTIEEAVSKELKSILGQDLNEIHPSSRKKIIDVIDKVGEEMAIKCCIVIDCSGSMAKKIDIAKNSILNLFRVLKNRKGKTQIAVIGYPGGNGQMYRKLTDFTEEIIELEKSLQRISIGGTTPTGPALEAAMELLLRQNVEVEEVSINEDEDEIFRSNII